MCDGRYRVGVSVQPSAARTVGDYTLLTRLGEGGMGVVHLARKPGGPRVALKVLRPTSSVTTRHAPAWRVR